MESINTSSFWNKAYHSALQMAKTKLDVKDQFWVEDIAQNAVLKAFLQFEKFDSSKGSFTNWLLTITKNLCYDFSKRKEKSFLKKEDTSLFSEIADFDHEDRLLLEEKYENLEKCISELKENDRKIIVMKYYKKASSRDIAKETKIPEANIPVYSKRVKLKLFHKMTKISA
jgi:RNA polymerase sigma factor (sigma-70 family)